jgi:hypothetical protein
MMVMMNGACEICMVHDENNRCGGERGIWNLDMSHFCVENYGFIRYLILEVDQI